MGGGAEVRGARRLTAVEVDCVRGTECVGGGCDGYQTGQKGKPRPE